MKNLFLIRTLIVLIPFFLTAFTGCETTKGDEIMPYNARIGLDGVIEFKEDFLKENLINGSYYNGENWEYADETYPKDRTYIITEKARLAEIFSVYPDIDFEKDMVVMYAYASSENNIIYQTKLISVTLDNKHLKIEFTIVGGNGAGVAHMPQRTFLPIRMDKLDIETVEFKKL